MLDPRLKHAVAVGKLGSFSRAAESVGVTQSAVTKSVADLERQLGHPLFHRTSRGVLMTEEGRDFLDRAARLLFDFAALMGDEERAADPYKGTIRLGIFPASIEWMLGDPLIGLLHRHPGVRYDIVTGTSERGVQLLTRGDIDVAFGMDAAFGSWGQFKCEPVGTLDAIPFVRRDHPLCETGERSIEALTRFDFVVPSFSEPYSSTVLQMYEQSGRSSRDRIHVVDFFPFIQRIIKTTDAIGFVTRDVARSDNFRANFAALDDLALFTAPKLCCAVRACWPARPAVRALIADIRHALIRSSHPKPETVDKG